MTKHLGWIGLIALSLLMLASEVFACPERMSDLTNEACRTTQATLLAGERNPSSSTGSYVAVRQEANASIISKTTAVTSGAEGSVVVGATYPIPRRSSVLVIGDSWANDIPFEAGGDFGDFPWQTRRFLRPYPIALNAGGFAGHTIDQITDQIATAVTRQASTPTAAPYTLCVAHGGTNDLAASRTLAQMQASRLAQNAAIEAAGMLPVLVTVPPYNALSAGNQTTMDAYNTWLKTLGYPLYDLNADANDGNDDLKASWDYGDGIHASLTNVGGAARYGQRLADLIMLIGDR